MKVSAVLHVVAFAEGPDDPWQKTESAEMVVSAHEPEELKIKAQLAMQRLLDKIFPTGWPRS